MLLKLFKNLIKNKLIENSSNVFLMCHIEKKVTYLKYTIENLIYHIFI